MSDPMPREWYTKHGELGPVGSIGTLGAEPTPALAMERPSLPSSDWWRPALSDPRLHDLPAVDVDAEAGSAVPFWSLLAFTLVMLFSPQQYFPALAPLRPALLLAGIGIVTYLLDRMARRLPIIEWTWELKLIAGLVAWAVVTIPFSLWPGGSVSMLVDVYLKSVVIFWLLSQVVVTGRRLRTVAVVLTVAAIGLGLFVAYNYMTGAFVDSLNQDRVMGNEGGLTKNPNDLALMVNLIVPLTIALLVSTRHSVQRMLLLLAIGIEILTVALTYSRGGAVTLGVILLVFYWKLRGHAERRWLYGLFLVGLMALPLAPASYFDRLSTITDINTDRTRSAQERWSDMVLSLKIIATNPVIGAGMGNNSLALRQSREGWLPVHNVYLEQGVDLGLPGLVLFLALLAACLKDTIVAQRLCRASAHRDTGALAEGLQVSLIAFATAAMFHPVSYHMYFYYMGGLAVAVRKLCATRDRSIKEEAA